MKKIMQIISINWTKRKKYGFTQEVTKYIAPKPAETIEETKEFGEKMRKGMQTGDKINFNKYEWRVLAIKNNAALIITEYIIE